MEKSILTSTKKLLNMGESYTAFDLDVITHINAAFGTLQQLGLGPVGGFSIEDSKAKWEDLSLPEDQLGLVKTYIYLKTKLVFDPPATSFHIKALEDQITQHEWRLNVLREEQMHPIPEGVT